MGSGVVAFIPLLYYAHARISDGSLSLGLFGGSLFSLFRMYDPIRKLSRVHVQLQRAMASGNRIVELLDARLEIPDSPRARALEGNPGSVEFRDVCFRYAGPTGETRVLDDINLRVERNQIIALVGASGSGKTSLVNLIPRFYDPTSGSVLIDGVDIRDYAKPLRRAIAMVTQETFLFNDTVRHNTLPTATSGRRRKGCGRPRGRRLPTASSRGFRVRHRHREAGSGCRGERQRISIARPLLATRRS